MMRIGVVLALLWLLGGALAPVLAQDPTATPGPLPTPTSVFVRPTPTPWALNPDPALVDGLAFGSAEVGHFADTVINSYNFVNRDGLVDYIIFLAVSVMLVGILTKLIRSGKQL